MSPAKDDALAAYAGHEKLTAARMKWWGVYLVREQRRLQAIADRVRAQEAARATGQLSPAPPGGPPIPPASEGETPDELLMRLDVETAGQDAPADLEEVGGSEADGEQTDFW